MSRFEEDNLITRTHIDEHRIAKYEFHPIVNDEPISQPSEQQTKEQQESIAAMNAAIAQENSLQNELIEKLLEKTDELSSSLAKLQIQFEKQQVEYEERLSTERNDAYKDGLRDGEEKTKNELESKLEKEKTAFINAAITLGKLTKDSQAHLQELEKELSAIAVDIAKEVIAKEVEDDSAAVASALAKELLKSISDTTDVYLKVNNLDYLEVTNALKEYNKINIEADNAVKKGGVIISNGGGIIDGSIANRYKTLKQSVLENLKET